ncbi:MAG: arginine repressor [Huintestinicola sp.]
MKNYRHEKILEIIKSCTVETQDMLRELLADEKISVTQATLSRDIKELGLEKGIDDNGNPCYIVPQKRSTPVPQIFRDSVIDVDHAGNTAVFKCHAGMAQAACITFDRQNYPNIVGTLAGDDTIFILMRTEKDAAAFVKEMRSRILEPKKGDTDAE